MPKERDISVSVRSDIVKEYRKAFERGAMKERRLEKSEDLDGQPIEIRFGSNVRGSRVLVNGEPITALAATVSVDGRDFLKGTQVELVFMPPDKDEEIVVKGTLLVDDSDGEVGPFDVACARSLYRSLLEARMALDGVVEAAGEGKGSRKLNTHLVTTLTTQLSAARSNARLLRDQLTGSEEKSE
jgi:hypothetical protein